MFEMWKIKLLRNENEASSENDDVGDEKDWY